VEKYRNPHGKLKENLFLPLFNTNCISKSFTITDLTTCGERHETF
jgi:predicted metalloprotease